jgi:hypothetical protein
LHLGTRARDDAGTSMRRATSHGVVLLLLALLLGCGGGRADQLMFRVVDGSATGLDVPTDVDRFTLTVSSVSDGGTTERFSDGWTLRPTDGSSEEGVILPQTLAVLPLDPERPSPVFVELAAFRGLSQILYYPLQAEFEEGLVTYDLPIDPQCFDVACPADQRCQLGRCLAF